MGGTVPEPDWEGALRATVNDWVTGGFIVKEGAYRALLPHIEAAYHRGLMAGRSQKGYTTGRKRREPPCATGTAGAAGSIPASPTGDGGET